MPRARLTGGTWRFESDVLDAIRAKLAGGRSTLAEVFGPPLYGIKTGLNAAFVLTREQRDAIVANAAKTGDRSADLLKPFLIGENLKRWHVQSDDLWLIYLPKNAIDIEEYPALRDYLVPYRARLESRATRQEWWELQQAQAAYEPAFLRPKVIYPHFNDRPNFSFDTDGCYSNDKSYVIPSDSPALAGFLNSKLAWFQLCGLAPAVRGGFREARVQFVGALRVPPRDDIEAALREPSAAAGQAARERASLIHSVLHRLSDIDTRVPQVAAMQNWPSMTFVDLQAALMKHFKAPVPVAERDEWEQWFGGKRAEAEALRLRIAAAEAEINEKVYRMFDLTKTEIDAIENSLAITSPALSLNAYEAISNVEGLELSDDARRRLADAEHRRTIAA